ncbi:MAG: amidase family protein, partial [Pseudomonadota bacterium]
AGLRVAVAREPGAGMPAADPALVEGIDAGLDVLASLGAELFDVRLPVAVADCFAATRMIGPTESAAIHEAELRTRPEAMGFALRDKLLYGSLVRAVDYVQAQRFAHHVAGQIDRLLRDYDALVTFGTLHLPPVLGVEPAMTAFTVDTMLTPFNLSGHPALVQCTGYSASGLPLHWQVVAKRGDEASGLRLARAYERATPWRRRRPPIVAALAEMTA